MTITGPRRAPQPDELVAQPCKSSPLSAGDSYDSRAPKDAGVTTVAVVVCGYTTERLPGIRELVSALNAQTRPPDEVILVSDYSEALYEALVLLEGVKVYANESAPGLSGARNTGWSHASSDVVAFLDDDAIPARGWLERLVGPLEEEPDTIATSGWVVPAGDSVPEWYPRELFWVLGCSWAGLESRELLRNPIGASMAWRREVLAAIDGFRSDIGLNVHTGGGAGSEPTRRISSNPRIRTCEETLAAIAATNSVGGKVRQVHDSVVRHLVPRERTSVSYLLRRAWGEGVSKSLVRRLGGEALKEERRHLTRMVLLLLQSPLHPRRWQAAAYMALGLGATVAGYAYGLVAVPVTGRLTGDGPTGPELPDAAGETGAGA